MSQLPRPAANQPGWLGRRLAFALVAGVVVLLGLGMWANALAEPVVRAGAPTGSVTPPPAKPSSTRPTASPSATPTPSKSGGASTSATPTATAKPSSKPTKASDQFATSTVTRKPVSGTGKQHTFIVKVQTATKLDADEVAKEVAEVLNDPRSWAGSGTVRFALVKDAKAADFTVYVSAPQAVDAKCGKAAWVCVRGGKLVLGAAGWATPAATYAGDTTGFRRYLVNNAVGSYLGEDKASCKKSGRPAPVMAPQGDDLKGCTPNPWPFG